MPTEDEGFTEADSGTESERLTRIEDRLDKLAAAVARLVPGSHAEAQQRTEQRLDRPSTVEEQVAAELAKRDQKAAADRDRESARADSEDTKTRLAKLEEARPEPPITWAERVTWGKRR